MKKSARYIYTRPIAGKRRSWRIPCFITCAVVVACFFLAYDDGMKLQAFVPESQKMALGDAEMPAAAKASSTVASGPEFSGPLAVSVPAGSSDVTPHEMAAMAAATDEEPERPGMLLATLGEVFPGLTNLPFFLPAPEEIEESSDDADIARAESDDEDDTQASLEILEEQNAGPAVYPQNKRYTVETNEQGQQIFYSTIAKGDTAGVILNEWMNAADTASAINAADKVYSLTNIREGRPFKVERTVEGENFLRFQYELDTRHCLVLERKGHDFVATLEAIEYDTELVRVVGNIESSLFEAVADAGEGPVLAVSVADVFSCEINFINEIRQDDHFEVLVEKLYRDGEFKSYGRMLAARFINQGHTYEAYLYPDGTGRLRHYNAKGEALQKTLLKAPLAFTRVSSGYSMNRKHPVFGNTRPHQGVDYAAPTGTPIKAVGDAVVTKAGWGNGYGNMVILKHSGGLESQYAHMSAIARGIKSGTRVKQGQTIGYVGATGVATGPHLDFRLKQNGKFINPTKVIVPREDPVDKKHLRSFQQAVALSRSYLDGDHALAEYTPVEWGK